MGRALALLFSGSGVVLLYKLRLRGWLGPSFKEKSMNARFVNKKVPAALAQAVANSTVAVTVVPARRRSKVKAKQAWSGSVLVIAK